MAVKLRLKRLGRRHRPFYRVVAADVRCPRGGNVIEELGTYDPMEKNKANRVKLDTERIEYWLSVGAQPTGTVRDMLLKAGLAVSSQARKARDTQAEAPEPTAAATGDESTG